MVGAGCSSQRSPGTTTPMPGGYASAIVAAAHLVDRHVVDLVSVLRHVSLPEHSLDEPRSRGEVYRSCRRHYGLQAADRIKENLSLCASTGAHRGRALTATGELLVHDRSVTSNVADRVYSDAGPAARSRTAGRLGTAPAAWHQRLRRPGAAPGLDPGQSGRTRSAPPPGRGPGPAGHPASATGDMQTVASIPTCFRSPVRKAARVPDRCALAVWPHPVLDGERCLRASGGRAWT